VCSAVLFVSACGGGTSATAGAASAPTTTASGGGGNTASGARAFPGATGLLAQIDGTTLQVQGTDAQTAVTYSSGTRFSNTVATQRSSIVVGDCVQVRSPRPASGTGNPPPTAVPGAATGPIMAASVDISPAVNGTCSVFGGLGAPGARPPGASGDATRPPGAPSSGQHTRARSRRQWLWWAGGLRQGHRSQRHQLLGRELAPTERFCHHGHPHDSDRRDNGRHDLHADRGRHRQGSGRRPMRHRSGQGLRHGGHRGHLDLTPTGPERLLLLGIRQERSRGNPTVVGRWHRGLRSTSRSNVERGCDAQSPRLPSPSSSSGGR